MRYPFAKIGVLNVLAAEIVSLICATSAIASSILQSVDPSSQGTASTVAASLTLVNVIGLILAYILQLIGLGQAGKDDNYFKIAFYIVISSVVLTATSAVLSVVGVPSLVVTIIDTIRDISGVFVIIYTLTGISTIAGALDNEELELKGRSLIYWISVLFFFSIVLTLVPQIIAQFITPGDGFIIAMFIITAFGTIAEFVVYILCLIYFFKSSKMLNAE